MKKAVIYGAGNIGRGFIGQLFFESGYATDFIDINKELIEQLNNAREYPVKFTDSERKIIIKNVRGIDGEARTQVAEAIAQADIMAVSVGANILKYIAGNIAAGINKRFADGNFGTFNIIMCENLIGAGKIMRGLVREHIKYLDLYDDKIGFIEASVGRMVPNQTDEMKSGNELRIVTESYAELPVDKLGFKGVAPEIVGMSAHEQFDYYIRRKLYIYNMGHAVCAYLGDIFGHEYIWQAMREPYIELIACRIMQRAAFALSRIYKADMLELNNYIENLIYRFGNKALGDTVSRVGNDLKRKLSPDDRIIGAYKICSQTGVPINYICLAIAAAVNFKGDKLSGGNMRDILIEAGSFDLISGRDLELVKKYDRIIKIGGNMRELLETVKRDEGG